MTQKNFIDVIIIGAGAAGLMCALTAGQRGKSVLVLEKSEKIGKKILISGGGRCNFTNTDAKPENYLSENPHFCRSALARYTPNDFIALVEKHGIAYHEKKLGQLFCDSSARDIVRMLEQECRNVGVRIQTQTHVRKLTAIDQYSSTENDTLFSVITTEGTEYHSYAVVIATGGPSIPKMGATRWGYDIARQFGHTIIPIRPALVPLLFDQNVFAPFTKLSGISLGAKVYIDSTSFAENILFTHRGLSGPAILQISSYWTEGSSMTIDLSPDVSIAGFLDQHYRSRLSVKNLLTELYPERFLSTWLSPSIASTTMAHTVHKDRERIAQSFHSWQITPIGDEGFAKAEVTRGGVDTAELSSKTMESRKQKGLYFIGEVVDVTGWLGGYNFQWAWASGYVAGSSV